MPSGTLLLPTTHAHLAAPVDHGRCGRPVVLYSPGLRSDRSLGTVLIEEPLKSRGTTAEGTVVCKIIRRAEAAGRTVDVSPDEPQYEVRSAEFRRHGGAQAVRAAQEVSRPAMQTFLSHPNIRRSALLLDRGRATRKHSYGSRLEIWRVWCGQGHQDSRAASPGVYGEPCTGVPDDPPHVWAASDREGRPC